MRLLFSYAHLRKHKKILQACCTLGRAGVPIIIDSGAFSAWRSGEPIDVNEYINFLKTHIHGFGPNTEYVALDVIKSPEKSMDNYEVMWRAGLTPAPVWVNGADAAFLKKCASHSNRIFVPGGTVSAQVGVQRLIDARKILPDASLHGLGLTAYPELIQSPGNSFDSSSYYHGPAFGQLEIFTKENGLKQVTLIAFLREQKPLPQWAVRLLKESGISLQDLGTKWFRAGACSGLACISISAHLKLYYLAERLNKLMFFVVMAPMNLIQMLASDSFHSSSAVPVKEAFALASELVKLEKENFPEFLTRITRMAVE